MLTMMLIVSPMHVTAVALQVFVVAIDIVNFGVLSLVMIMLVFQSRLHHVVVAVVAAADEAAAAASAASTTMCIHRRDNCRTAFSAQVGLVDAWRMGFSTISQGLAKGWPWVSVSTRHTAQRCTR